MYLSVSVFSLNSILFRKKNLCMTFILFNLQVVFWPRMRYILVNVPYVVGKNVYSLFDQVLSKYQLAGQLIVQFRSFVFLMLFIIFLCVIETGISNYYCGFIYFFFHFIFFMHFETLLCMYACIQDFCLNELSHLSFALRLVILLVLNLTMSDISIATPHLTGLVFA